MGSTFPSFPNLAQCSLSSRHLVWPGEMKLNRPAVKGPSSTAQISLQCVLIKSIIFGQKKNINKRKLIIAEMSHPLEKGSLVKMLPQWP